MFKLKQISHSPIKRLLSTSSNVLERLKQRTLIRVAGSEVSNFLQGLITNDIEHLSSGPGCMYTMFLNNMGRILYDAIVYRNIEHNVYFIECDNEISDVLEKHLKMYRVRRKIDIANVGDEFKLHVLFHDKNGHGETNGVTNPLHGVSVPCQQLNKSIAQNTNKTYRDLEIYHDPRITDLGSRIIAKDGVNVHKQISETVNLKNDSNINYRWLRYSLGVGEGIKDLPPSDSFPLECNCDYLHGVSFHKGCYVGQELTARVHHTGVVRKRLMPIHFITKPSKMPDEKVLHENVNLGKLKGIENDVGLGLLRIAKALAFKEIKFGDGVGTTCKPHWWPSEAPKEKMNISKTQ